MKTKWSEKWEVVTAKICVDFRPVDDILDGNVGCASSKEIERKGRERWANYTQLVGKTLLK